MTNIPRPSTIGRHAVKMICTVAVLVTALDVSFVPEAKAFFVRRHVRRAAVVTTVAVASTTANANAAAAANANAAAANANAAAAAAAAAEKSHPPPAAAPAGSPAVGTIVTTIPPGGVQEKLNGVDYMRVGTTYYKASMMGNNLVFVVSQP